MVFVSAQDSSLDKVISFFATSLSILNLGLGYNMISHVTVTKYHTCHGYSHTIICLKEYKRFQNYNVIYNIFIIY